MTANLIDLTWLDAVKRRAEAGVLPDGTIAAIPDDSEIQAAITGFSQYLLNYTGQASLNSVASIDDEVYDGNGNSRMPTRSWPIKTLRSVTAGGAAIQLSASAGSWGAYVDAAARSIALRNGCGAVSTFYGLGYGRSSRGMVFPRGIGNILLSYDAGYDPFTVVNEIDLIVNQTITLQRGPWVADGGVLYYPSLLPLDLVENSPGPGQYAVSGALYVFNGLDNGQYIAVTYDVNAAPFDLEYAVRCVVAINYKRKGWQDLKSRGVSSGSSATATTGYRDWDWPEEYDRVFEHYKRMATPL